MDDEQDDNGATGDDALPGEGHESVTEPPSAGEPESVETAAPPVDTAAPPVDTAAPPVDTAAPPTDTAAPPIETAPEVPEVVVAGGVTAETEPPRVEEPQLDEAATTTEWPAAAEAVEVAVAPEPIEPEIEPSAGTPDPSIVADEAELDVDPSTAVVDAPAPAPVGGPVPAAPPESDPPRPSIGDTLTTAGSGERADQAPGAGQPAPAPALAHAAPALAAGYQSGQLVAGTILAFDEKEVVLDLGEGKRGVISSRHLTLDSDSRPGEIVKVGERIEGAVLLREDRENRIVLSRAWALKRKAWDTVEAAKADGSVVAGKVTEVVKGGVVVDIGLRAFMPASLVDNHHVEKLADWVGRDVEVKVTELDREREKVVVSRRAVLRQQEKQRTKALLEAISVGDVKKGTVTGLADFGAFVDIGGTRGLLHMSEMSWRRVADPAEVVSVGQQLDLKIIGLKKGGRRISLSLRALTPDPLRATKVGSVVEGTVNRLADFGAFVLLDSGAEGLVHISELSEYRVDLPEEVVTPGDRLWVKVIGVDKRRRRIDLSVNQAVVALLDPAIVTTHEPVATGAEASPSDPETTGDETDHAPRPEMLVEAPAEPDAGAEVPVDRSVQAVTEHTAADDTSPPAAEPEREAEEPEETARPGDAAAPETGDAPTV